MSNTADPRLHQTTVTSGTAPTTASAYRAAGEPISDAPRAVAMDDAKMHSQAAAQDVKYAAGQTAQQAQNAAGNAAHRVDNAAGRAADQAGNAANNAANRLDNAAGRAADQAGNAANNAANRLDNAAGRAADQVGNAAQRADQAAGQAVTQASNAASNAAQKVDNAAGQAASSLGNAAQRADQAAGQAATQVNQAAHQASNAVQEKGQQLSASAQETARQAQDQAKRAQDQAGNKLNQAGNKLNQAAGQANERLHAVGEQVAHHPMVQSATQSTQQQLNVLDQQLARFGFLNEFEARTRIPKTYGVLGFSITISALILLNLFGLAQPITNLIGWALPAYLSCYALESPQKGDDAQWLCYWIVFGFLNYIESAALRVVLYYIPHYFTLKLAATVWLMLPQTRGAERVYYSALRPLFQQGSLRAREIGVTGTTNAYGTYGTTTSTRYGNTLGSNTMGSSTMGSNTMGSSHMGSNTMGSSTMGSSNLMGSSSMGMGSSGMASNRFGTTSAGVGNDSYGYSTGVNTHASALDQSHNPNSNPFASPSAPAAGGLSGYEGMGSSTAGQTGSRVVGVVVPPVDNLSRY